MPMLSRRRENLNLFSAPSIDSGWVPMIRACRKKQEIKHSNSLLLSTVKYTSTVSNKQIGVALLRSLWQSWLR